MVGLDETYSMFEIVLLGRINW